MVVRRTRFDLARAEERAHILEGLRKALEFLDLVIRLIRGAASVDAARDALMSQLELSEIQAKAILDMRLQRLTQLEREKVVQEHTDTAGGEITPAELWRQFRAEYLDRERPLALNSVHTSSAAGERDALTVKVYVDGEPHTMLGEGNGPINAFCEALASIGVDVRVLDYHEHALSAGGDATAAAYVECAVGEKVVWGVGLDANIVTASLKAVISAINRV